MTIQNELNKIKTAVLGKDVRTAIHDSIKKTYDDATENGNANMEVEMARGIHPNLNKRLTSSEQEIDVEKKRIDNLAKLGEGSTTGDAELIDARVGADGITYANAGGAIRNQFDKINNDLVSHKEDYATLKGVNKGAVTHEKTTFLSVGKNKFNKKKTLLNHHITTSGGISPMDSWGVSEFISVATNENYVVSGGNNYVTCFYDSGKVFMSSTSNSEFTTPTNSTYVRTKIYLPKIDKFQMEVGLVATLYENFNYVLKDMEITSKFDNALGLRGSTTTPLYEKGKLTKVEERVNGEVVAFTQLIYTGNKVTGYRELINGVVMLNIINADLSITKSIEGAQ